MEERTHGRSASDASLHHPPKPEVVSICSQQTELQEDLSKISSLRDLFVKQSQTLAMLGSEEHSFTLVGSSVSFESPTRSTNTWTETAVSLGSSDFAVGKSFEDNLETVTKMLQHSSDKATQDASPKSAADIGIFMQSSFAGVDRILNYDEESDDIDSTGLSSVDGSDSDIQAAINELRKEASQIDIIMALDSLKTVEAELLVATRALRERATQAEDLRSQLEEKQEQMASLELERDLYKADATKLKDDLKTCVDRMFDISAMAGSSFLPDTAAETKFNEKRKTPGDHAIHRQNFSPSVSSITPFPLSSPLDSSGRMENSHKVSHLPEAPRGPVIRRQACKSDPLASSSFYSLNSAVTEVFPLLGSSYSNEIFRRDPKSEMPSSPEKSLSTRSMSTESLPVDPEGWHPSFSAVTLSPAGSKTYYDDTVDSKRRCALFRRRNSKRSLTSTKEVVAMKDQIDQLHIMMKASLETSEKLRKRLAMISGYYEGIIKKLQQQMVEVKTENSKRKADMDSKMALLDHDNRVAILHLETQLQHRESEIGALKEKLSGIRYEI